MRFMITAILYFVFSASRADAHSMFKIAYIPIKFNYFKEPTEKNLEDSYSHYVFSMKLEEAANLFTKVGDVKSGKVGEPDKLRIKISSDKRDLFIQRDKNIYSSGRIFNMDPNVIDRVLNQIQAEVDSGRHKAKSEMLDKINKIEKESDLKKH